MPRRPMFIGEGLAPLRLLARAAWMLSALLLFTGALLAQPQPTGESGAGTPGALSSVPAARRAKNIAVITIRGDIDRVMSASVRRRIAAVEAGGADAVVFEIDTFGGELGAALEICNAIESCKKPTTAWVNVKGISAGAIIALACNEIVAAPAVIFGDAAPIALSGGQLKSLERTERAKILTPILTQLVNSARRNGYDEQFVQGFAMLDVELWLVERADTGERRFVNLDEYRYLFGADPTPGARPALAGLGVTGGAPRTWSATPARSTQPPAAPASPTDLQPAGRVSTRTVDAVNMGLTQTRVRRDLAPADVGKWRLLEYVSDGKGIYTLKASDMRAYGLAAAEVSTDQELKTFFGGENIVRIEPAWYETLAKWLDGMVIKGVLIILFLLGLFVEMMHPGLVLPGTVSFLSLVLILAPDILLGAGGWWEVIAILVGIGCILLEIFILPGFGVFGIAGLILLFGGLLGTFMPGPGFFPDSPEAQSNLVHGVATLLISTVVAIVCMYFLGKHFGSLPLLNRLVLKSPTAEDASPSLIEAMADPVDGPVQVGATGIAITPLRPSGRVQVGDEIVDVVAEIGFIPAGQPVRISRVAAFCINVEPLTPDTRMDGHGAGGGEQPHKPREGGRA